MVNPASLFGGSSGNGDRDREGRRRDVATWTARGWGEIQHPEKVARAPSRADAEDGANQSPIGARGRVDAAAFAETPNWAGSEMFKDAIFCTPSRS